MPGTPPPDCPTATLAWGDRWEAFNWSSFADSGSAQGVGLGPYTFDPFSTPAGLDIAQPSLLTTDKMDFVKSSTCGPATLHIDTSARLYGNGESHTSTRNLISNSRVLLPTRLTGGSITTATAIVDVSCGGELFDSAPDANNQLLHGAMLALDSSGNLHAWGRNEYGQLGTGAAGLVSNPVVVWNAALRGRTAIMFSSGRDHCVLLDSLGAVWTAGRNNHGQLGRGTLGVDSQSWGQVTLSGTPIAVKASNQFTLALLSDGTVVGWGQGDNGQLGPDLGFDHTVTPIVLPGLAGIIAIDAYHQWSWFLDTNGVLWWYGVSFNWHSANSEFGSGGPGKVVLDFTLDGSGLPVPVEPAAKWFVKLANAGGNSSTFDYGFGAIGTDGKLYAWGAGSHRRFGRGEDRTGLVPSFNDPTEIAPLGLVLNYSFGPSTHVANCDSNFLTWQAVKSGEAVTGKTQLSSSLVLVTDDDSTWLDAIAGFPGPAGGLEDALTEGPPGATGGPYGYRKRFDGNIIGRTGLVHVRLKTNDTLSTPRLHNAGLPSAVALTNEGIASGVRTWWTPPFTGTALPVVDLDGPNLLSGSYTASPQVLSSAQARTLELWNGSSNNAPPSGWEMPGFDDSAWGLSAIATPEAGFTFVGQFIAPTSLPPSNTREYLTRQYFAVDVIPSGGITLTVSVDDATDAVYVNGLLVSGSALGLTTATDLTVPAGYFVVGVNVIAVKVRNVLPTRNGVGYRMVFDHIAPIVAYKLYLSGVDYIVPPVDGGSGASRQRAWAAVIG